MTADNKSRLSVRWGDLLGGGFLVIPVLLLKRQHELGLGDGEFITLLHLLSAWWEKDDLPTLGAARIARHCGSTQRSVQRHLQSLKKKGLICSSRIALKNEPDKLVPCYDPTPTIEKLQALDVSRVSRSVRINLGSAELNLQ